MWQREQKKHTTMKIHSDNDYHIINRSEFWSILFSGMPWFWRSAKKVFRVLQMLNFSETNILDNLEIYTFSPHCDLKHSSVFWNSIITVLYMTSVEPLIKMSFSYTTLGYITHMHTTLGYITHTHTTLGDITHMHTTLGTVCTIKCIAAKWPTLNHDLSVLETQI